MVLSFSSNDSGDITRVATVSEVFPWLLMLGDCVTVAVVLIVFVEASPGLGNWTLILSSLKCVSSAVFTTSSDLFGLDLARLSESEIIRIY